MSQRTCRQPFPLQYIKEWPQSERRSQAPPRYQWSGGKCCWTWDDGNRGILRENGRKGGARGVDLRCKSRNDILGLCRHLWIRYVKLSIILKLTVYICSYVHSRVKSCQMVRGDRSSERDFPRHQIQSVRS